MKKFKIKFFRQALFFAAILFSASANAQLNSLAVDADGHLTGGVFLPQPVKYKQQPAPLSTSSYGNIRALSELNDPLNADAYPWISGDGLRLYYTSGANGNQLMYTYRNSTSTNFVTPVVVPISLTNISSCWLSYDELDVYICTTSSLYRAHRNTTASAFGTPVNLSLVSGPTFTSIKGASFDSLQNRVYLQLYDGTSNIIAEYYNSALNQFTYSSQLILPPGYVPSIGQISKDDLTYFVGARYNNGDASLYQYTRPNFLTPFNVSSFQQVQGINDPTMSNTQPSMSNSLDWVAFVRNDTNLWTANQLYIAKRTSSVSCSVPGQPGTIYGNTVVINGSAQTYSVAPVAGAIAYNWALPSGWTGNSTTNSINVTVGAIGGIISVVAQNTCGISLAKSINVTVTCPPPNQPSTIFGNTSINSGSAQTYSIAPVAGAMAYNWTLPSGWTGNSTTNSINVTAGTTGGIISVVVQNNCGTSPAKTLNITIATQGGGGSGSGAICSAQLVKDIVTGGSGSSIALIKNVNNQLFFAADDWTNGNELWTSDGTDPNTVLVKDIYSGNDGLSTMFPTKFAELNNNVFFVAITANEGAELWKSDGTAAGTMMVKDINPGTSSGVIVTHAQLINFNGYVYFQADDGVNGEELWRTDGTSAGTLMVKNIATTWSDAYIKNFTISGNNLFFSANDSNIGDELWKTDGTAAGTVLVKNIASSGGSYPEFLIDVNGTLFFVAYTATAGRELWKSDGTNAGTVLVKDINPGTNPSIQYTNVNNFVSDGNILYFTATDGVNGVELWKSDGTTAGTNLIKDVRPGANGGLDVSNYKNFIVINGTLYFMGNDGINGRELWKSDGTNSGTVLLKDIRTGSMGSDPEEFINYNNNLLFAASSNGVSRLWYSDGTTNGTAIIDAQGPSGPRNLTIMGGKVYFSAYTITYGDELYVCDPALVSVKEYNNHLNDVVVYPNPGTGIFKIKSENQLNYTGIKIYNTHGQLVYESTQFIEELDLSSQPKGIYFIQLQSKEGVSTQKIIIQ